MFIGAAALISRSAASAGVMTVADPRWYICLSEAMVAAGTSAI